jgi:hypothetical protein
MLENVFGQPCPECFVLRASVQMHGHLAGWIRLFQDFARAQGPPSFLEDFLGNS